MILAYERQDRHEGLVEMTVLEFAVDLPCKVAICARKWSSRSLERVSLLGVYPGAARRSDPLKDWLFLVFTLNLHFQTLVTSQEPGH